jgi:hypothetical protein
MSFDRTPNTMTKLLLTLTAFAGLGASSLAGPLDGVWINTDPATRSIPKIEISGTRFVWWGKTHPKDTKYGPARLTLLGDSTGDASPDKYGYVTHDAKFADKTYFLKRVGDQLVLEYMTVFKDGSKRANNLQTVTFQKEP